MSAEPTAAAVPWTARFWPTDPDSAASPAVLAAALAVGVFAALTLRLQMVGAAYLVTGVGVLAVALGSRARRPTAAELVPAVLAVALLGVGVFRTAPWLVIVCLLAAWAVGTLALVGGRTWTGVVLGALASGLVLPRAARWVRRALVGVRLPGLTSRRGWLVMAVTVGLLALFGGLFATADPAYAALIDGVSPSLDVPHLLSRFGVLAAVTAGAVMATYLAHRPPTADALAPPPGRPVRGWELAVPLVVLDLLLASFVMV